MTKKMIILGINCKKEELEEIAPILSQALEKLPEYTGVILSTTEIKAFNLDELKELINKA